MPNTTNTLKQAKQASDQTLLTEHDVASAFSQLGEKVRQDIEKQQLRGLKALPPRRRAKDNQSADQT
jgi:hypothetical protein